VLDKQEIHTEQSRKCKNRTSKPCKNSSFVLIVECEVSPAFVLSFLPLRWERTEALKPSVCHFLDFMVDSGSNYQSHCKRQIIWL